MPFRVVVLELSMTGTVSLHDMVEEEAWSASCWRDSLVDTIKERNGRVLYSTILPMDRR